MVNKLNVRVKIDDELESKTFASLSNIVSFKNKNTFFTQDTIKVFNTLSVLVKDIYWVRHTALREKKKFKGRTGPCIYYKTLAGEFGGFKKAYIFWKKYASYDADKTAKGFESKFIKLPDGQDCYTRELFRKEVQNISSTELDLIMYFEEEIIIPIRDLYVTLNLNINYAQGLQKLTPDIIKRFTEIGIHYE